MAARKSRKSRAPRKRSAPRKFIACRAVAVPLSWPEGDYAGWGVWDFGALRVVADLSGPFAKSHAVAAARKLNTEDGEA